MNYYNENDPKAAAWLRELIREGHISNGVVDERSIADVLPTDLHGYNQCHFFAGIGGWSYALRLAGVPDDQPVWTGSCPCQPFSQAGLQLGSADARHLWPVFFRLIAECHPATVLGEQVASKDGRKWLAGVFADMEGVGYCRAGADLCAASVGAPHIRQRLYWVADADGRNTSTRIEQRSWKQRQQSANCGDSEGVGNSAGEPVCWRGQPWEPSVTIECEDGSRRLGPGALAVAHGVPHRMAKLRGLGNAIVPQVAAEFIGAFYEALCDGRSDVLMEDPFF